MPPAACASLLLTSIVGGGGVPSPTGAAAVARRPEERNRNSAAATPAARQPTMTTTVGTGATSGSVKAAATAIAARTTTPARAAIGERRLRIARRPATTRAPMTIVEIKTGMSAWPRVSMARVANPPGVSSMTRCESATKTEGTPAYSPWINSARPNDNTAPAAPAVTAFHLEPIAPENPRSLIFTRP